MYQTETILKPIGNVTRSKKSARIDSITPTITADRDRFGDAARVNWVLTNLVFDCKILKQIADSLKEWLGGVKCGIFRVLEMLTNEVQGVDAIALSQSGAEFFLDNHMRNSYHDPKFSSDVSRVATFHLRHPEKSLNWRSCIRARVALLFGLRVSDALVIEGRKLKG